MLGAGVKDFLDLFKLRIGFAIALTAVAGLMVQPGPAIGPWRAIALTLAVLVASAAAGAFNQFFETDLDVLMKRTRTRPFVTGRMRRHGGWLALIATMVAIGVAVAWQVNNASAALYTFLGAFFYAIVYTVWLKRRTCWNIVIGGLAGSFAVLAGAAAIAPTLSNEALLLALVLFLWTPPHFWSLSIVCREDYAAAGIPMLPVVKGDRHAARTILRYAVVMVALSLSLVAFSPGWIYAVCAATGGGLFVWRAARLAQAPSRASALASFHASLVQLSLMLLGVIVDSSVRSVLA